MNKIDFVNNGQPAINDTSLNQMQDNIEEAITIDTIKNENGTATKFPDGTLICRNSVAISITSLESWGVLYESTGNSLGDFAYPFIEIPHIVAQNRGVDYNIENLSGTTKTSAGLINLNRPTNTTANTIIDYIAIGRWK